MDRLQRADPVTIPALVTSPAWVPLLEHANVILTALSLTLGVLIGAIRLWQMVRGGKGDAS